MISKPITQQSGVNVGAFVSGESVMNRTPMEDGLLTVPELSERLRVKTSWVYTHADELGAYRLGKYLRFSWERVLANLSIARGTLGSQPNDVQKSQ